MNSIRQVPSRVKSRRTESVLGAEREHFEKQQLSSISKAINSTETPLKEKHARRIILGTHREKGAYTFWSYAVGLPLPSSAILSWKFCHVLHKILRDGHRNTLQDCMRHYSDIAETGLLWTNTRDRHGYALLVSLHAKLLCTKIEFHTKHSEIPASLEVTDELLERTAGTDINNVFQLTVEVFDYMDAELRLAEAVLHQLNMSIAISTLTSGQCKLAPLIQVIQDCSHLYHYTVKLLFKLHACLPADTLQGHRERFHDQFHSLKTFLNKARDMLYFKRLIQIPRLPDSPPNFLRASALAEHVKPMVVIPDEEELEEQEEDEPEPLIDVSEALPVAASQPLQSDIFDQAFGPPKDGFDDRDLQIERLKREIELLQAELEKIKGEAQRYITQLKAQINSLEGELEEQRMQKQRTLVENEQLRMELEATHRRNTEHESMQTNFVETEKRAQATELRYNKLKEKHAELVANHAELLRKSADTVKMLSATQQTQEEIERTKQQLAFEVDRVKQESDMKFDEQKFEMDKLKRELEAKAAEIQKVRSSLQTSEMTGVHMNSSMAALQAEKDRLTQSISKKDAELSSLKKESQLKESSLQQERDRTIRELEELQGKLKEKLSREEQLQQKLLDEQFTLLQATVTEAENIIQDAVAKLDDPIHISCSSSPDYLISRAEATLGSVEKVQAGHSEYVKSMKDAGGLVRALTMFSHLAADTIINGSATAHMAPTDHADRLTEQCKSCATQSLQYLKSLKSKASLRGADPTAIQAAVQKILRIGKDLRPKGLDVGKDELGDMVDKEMAATSAAIEEAVRRIDEMMSQTRKDATGVQLEVNERILNSCTDLMQAIRLLVLASTDLQKEIVEGGRGAASVREFYARNSRWTEGLISASKAVGWGATQMVDSADKVVLHTGKYEELIVCSHEIAASTAQLVAASKVKADRGSKRLGNLQQASRHVNEMAAKVVASTKTGQDQVEDKDTMDFSGLSLIKLKKEEMESQVKVLELETMLENERLRLGELRKKHYEIAGVPLEQLSEDNGLKASPASPKPSSKPGLMKKPVLAQKPNIPPKTMLR
ncbi:huntingtin interacting protein 1 related b [Danio rerio]|uniref:Huntingtin-interacting protein 1-related protein n=1 Tax=Danio rerio TaxID=7955 RepID=A0A0R4IKR8_DANRE|nr:huntingtin interacting protein 1 related b [Danio rerio]|eukprot:NP_001077034.2 huntingtin-interacting protein 1-related protein [Danio rerio]